MNDDLQQYLACNSRLSDGSPETPPVPEAARGEGAAPAPLKLIADCLDHGRMAWKIWAEHWRTNPAYGNGQPKIHETHAKLIADFDKAIEALRLRGGKGGA